MMEILATLVNCQQLFPAESVKLGILDTRIDRQLVCTSMESSEGQIIVGIQEARCHNHGVTLQTGEWYKRSVLWFSAAHLERV